MMLSNTLAKFCNISKILRKRKPALTSHTNTHFFVLLFMGSMRSKMATKKK